MCCVSIVVKFNCCFLYFCRLIYFSKNANAGGIWHVGIDGTGSGVDQFTIACKWITFSGKENALTICRF